MRNISHTDTTCKCSSDLTVASSSLVIRYNLFLLLQTDFSILDMRGYCLQTHNRNGFPSNAGNKLLLGTQYDFYNFKDFSTVSRLLKWSFTSCELPRNVGNVCKAQKTSERYAQLLKLASFLLSLPYWDQWSPLPLRPRDPNSTYYSETENISSALILVVRNTK